jgi:hypothetical protein
MAGEGRPSTSISARAKEEVDGGAKPRHDDSGNAALLCQRSEAITIELCAHSLMEVAAPLRSSQ